MKIKVNRKIKKLVLNPGLFFRDMLLNKYPLTNKADINRPRKNDSVAKEATQSRPEVFTSGFIPARFPIDIVYTWVDSSAQEFQYQKAKHHEPGTFKDEAVYEARFKSRDELLYSLRSINEYAPWVRKIFIVTNGQIPSWLSVDHHKIQLVRHSEIIDERYLPTFNSHVIESCLHKITGLSEHYVYFNDDVLLLRNAHPSDFFTDNGLAFGFISRAIIPNAPRSPLDTPSIQAIKNARELILNKYGVYFDRKFAHTFHPQLRSVAEITERDFWESFATCRQNKFRHQTDILCTSFLNPCLAFITGKGLFAQTRAWYFNIRDVSARHNYDALLFTKGESDGPLSVCVNDHLNVAHGNTYIDYEIGLAKFFAAYYPNPGPWEK